MVFERHETLWIGRFAAWLGETALCHAFSTRAGGGSAGAYARLNLGVNTADDPAAVGANLGLFLGALGADRGRLALTRQVHGALVAHADAPGVYEGADALVTDTPGLLLSVQVADCVPVFLFDPVRRAAGIAHAGWKGSALGIAALTVRAMAERFGSRPSDLEACIGPSIGPCCYTVGPDVAGAFPPGFLNETRLDLWEHNRAGLVGAGLAGPRVHAGRVCTRCHPDLFFSHRGDGGTTGRMMGVIGIRGG